MYYDGGTHTNEMVYTYLSRIRVMPTKCQETDRLVQLNNVTRYLRTDRSSNNPIQTQKTRATPPEEKTMPPCQTLPAQKLWKVSKLWEILS